ncbi:MAG: hypothetical protein ACQKBU_04505 [Verrucomicrobiales bacterium]
MSLSIDINENSEEIRSRIQALAAKVKPGRDLHRALAAGVRHRVREHFRKLALERNSSGGAGGRKAFYAQARDATRSVATETEAKVEVTGPRGIRQRLLGGTIKPKDGEFLAIPLVDELKGIRAAEVYESLELQAIVNRRKKTGILYSGRDYPDGIEPGHNVRDHYALVKEVTQKPDRTVLQSDAELLSSAADAAEDYVNLMAAKELN